MIKYALFLNKLTPEPLDCAARVVDVPAFGLDDIVKIATQEGKTMTEEEMYAAYSSIEKAMTDIISQGGSVQLSILSTSFTISGVFENDQEVFTEGKHQLNLKMQPGDGLVTAARKNHLKRVKAKEYAPEPTRLEDIASGTVNELLSPGNMACLKGTDLKFDPEQADEGLYVVSDRGPAMKVEQLARNMPGELVFLVPAKMSKGSYWLEVRNRSYQTLSTGRLKHPLVVK